MRIYTLPSILVRHGKVRSIDSQHKRRPLMPRAALIAFVLALFTPVTIAWSADQDKPATAGSRGDDALPQLSHSSISVPFDDLRGLLEKSGRTALRSTSRSLPRRTRLPLPTRALPSPPPWTSRC
jgi:hypothetical protein